MARMARVKMPEYQIAFVSGIGMKVLRALYGEEMMVAAIEAEVEVRETLLRLAASGKHAGATMFWARAYCGFDTGRKKDAKKASDEDEEPYNTGPDDFQVFGPNGERLD